MTQEQKEKLLKAKIAVSFRHVTGKVPTEEQIDDIYVKARVLWHVVLGAHYKRKEMKKTGQLAIF
jgi:hypothetical protein